MKITAWKGKKKINIKLEPNIPGSMGKYFEVLMDPDVTKIVIEKPKPKPLKSCKGFIAFNPPKRITGIKIK